MDLVVYGFSWLVFVLYYCFDLIVLLVLIVMRVVFMLLVILVLVVLIWIAYCFVFGFRGCFAVLFGWLDNDCWLFVFGNGVC